MKPPSFIQRKDGTVETKELAQTLEDQDSNYLFETIGKVTVKLDSKPQQLTKEDEETLKWLNSR
jgi:hypothetical protein